MQVVIEGDVGVGGALPAEVRLHGVLDQAVERGAVVPEQAGGAEHGVCHLVAVEVSEREAGALAGVAVVGDDRVLEAAGLAHDGQGAVAHGDHLR